MISYDRDPLLNNKTKNIYSCLVKQKDLKDKNFQLRTPSIKIDKEGLVKLIKSKYPDFNKGFTYLIKELEKYLKVEYTSIHKTKYRYLQNFKKNELNIIFLRVISLALADNIKNSIRLFHTLSIHNNFIYIKNLKLKINNFNKRISYLIGVITGDGHLNKKDNNLSITDGQSDNHKLILSKLYLKSINNLFSREFNIQGKLYRKKEKCWVCRFDNKWLCRFINHYFEVPFGKKCDIVKFPKVLSNQEQHFWRGLMDTDGYIREQAKQISVKSNSSLLIKQFEDFCKKNNINADVIKEKNGNVLRIFTKSYLNYANTVGFFHPRKKALLISYLKEGPKYKTVKTNIPLLNFLRPYKNGVYISFSQHNKKTDKTDVRRLVKNIIRTFNVKVIEIKRKRYNNHYFICSKSFSKFVRNNITYELPWQPLNKIKTEIISRKWRL